MTTDQYTTISSEQHLVHLLDKSIDVLLSVTKITTLNEMKELSLVESTIWIAQLEWPQEVACLLEVWSNSVDLMNQIFHTNDTEFSKVVLDQLVVSESDSLLVDLAISSLVNQLSSSLQVWITICDVWIDDSQHLLSSLGQLDEDTIVDLQKSEKLKDLSWFWCNLADTLDSNDEDEFWSFLDIEVS